MVWKCEPTLLDEEYGTFWVSVGLTPTGLCPCYLGNHGTVVTCPEEGHKDEQGAGTPLLWRLREDTGEWF